MTEEKPPVFQTWGPWYRLVLGAMILQVLLYYLITLSYS